MNDRRVQRSPYVIGRAITEKEQFFGRESLLNFLKDYLTQNAKVLLLHGQRRIGKSSILHQIPISIQEPRFQFVFFDLQAKSQLSLGEILHDLAQMIVDRLQLKDQVIPPLIKELDLSPEIFQDFLRKVFEELGDKNLILLLDEFDVLSNDNPNSADKRFFPYLATLVHQVEKLFVIPVLGRKLDDLPNLQELFKEAPNYEIDLLDHTSARRLITNPASGSLKYDEDAINAILGQSAGHPYFTQTICTALFEYARESQTWRISAANVQAVLDTAIERAQGGLAWFWDGLPLAERVVFASVAEAQEKAGKTPGKYPEEPLTLLRENYGVEITEPLHQGVRRLIERKYLNEEGRKVRVELVRRWLIQDHPLQQEIYALERLDDAAQKLYEGAEQVRSRSESHDSLISFYEGVLSINPNHFGSLFRVAELYLDRQEYGKAIDLYTRAYQVNPIRVKESYEAVLVGYGDQLMKEGRILPAKGQFAKALEINPKNRHSEERLQEIRAIEKMHGPAVPEKRRISLLESLQDWKSGTVLFILVGLLIGLGYWLGRGCFFGQVRVGGVCQRETSDSLNPSERLISRGDYNFFSDKRSSSRDRGLAAFQEGNFANAVQLFQQAVEQDRAQSGSNDPEILIYYNNALAHQRGNPLTLALVVPIGGDNRENAEQMMRGVAQAQHEFNQKRDANDRLLEIIIADDRNDPEQAKQVAQAIVDNYPDVLGVIGHNSSEASKAALEIYEQAGLAMISPTSSSASLDSPVFFRTVASNASTGRDLAQFAVRELGLRRVAIFYSKEDPYSDDISSSFRVIFEDFQGSTVVARIDVSDPDFDSDEVIRRCLEDLQAEAAVLFPAVSQFDRGIDVVRSNSYIAQDLQKPPLQLLSSSVFYNREILEKGGRALEDLLLVVPWFPDPKLPFTQRANALWAGTVNWRTASSFDAAQAFIATLEKSENPTQQTVLQNLVNINLSADETSSNREEQFDNDHQFRTPTILLTVRNNNQGQNEFVLYTDR